MPRNAHGQRHFTSDGAVAGALIWEVYHRVLSRAVWSSRKVARRLLIHLIGTFVPSGVVVMGIDDTIERRKGKRISARGIYRDAVRSSDSQVVKVSGLRWLSLMLLVEIPWAQSVWALPFLTVLAPSERYHQQQGLGHKTLTDWARQMLNQVRRWLPERAIVAVGDSSFAVLELLGSVSQLPHPVHLVSRLRLDAALYEPAAPRQPHQMGRTRLKGKRLPTLNDTQTVWQSVILQHWYGNVERFVEVTFEQVRAHLGVETQGQWSDLAILRTTPALFGLFSLVTLFAHYLQAQQPFPLPQTAWYSKSLPTFVDALAAVRRSLWAARLFEMSVANRTAAKVPPELLKIWSNLLCYAA